MENNTVPTVEQIKYGQRLQRVEDAIALKEPDKIPLAPFMDGIIQNLYGSSYRNIFYDRQKAIGAVMAFYNEYPQCDAAYGPLLTSGKALELAGFNFLDWPGRPGTKISDYSTHQILEHAYMEPEEYPELLKDFTGFMIRKFFPRAFDNLKGLSGIEFKPSSLLSTSILRPLTAPAMEDTYKLLLEIGKLDAENNAAFMGMAHALAGIGMPAMFMGSSEAPYDIIADYFRGTVGMMEDLFEHEDDICAVCDMFADQQIQALQYLRFIQMPGKRIFFPLHKGMDGFMNARQYEKLYWKPLKKIMLALIDMGVTPYIYTEGKYNTRLQQLADVPKGKVIYHFEEVDMKEAKRILGGIACISGNLPAAMLEFGKKQEVIDYCKYLIDTCAPGGGYIFDTNACVEGGTRENIDTMFNTFDTHK